MNAIEAIREIMRSMIVVFFLGLGMVALFVGDYQAAAGCLLLVIALELVEISGVLKKKSKNNL